MPLFRQLELNLAAQVAARDLSTATERSCVDTGLVQTDPAQLPDDRDPHLEQESSALLRVNGAMLLAPVVRVVWDKRLKSCAGRADFKAKLITLNPLLIHHGQEEIDRTVRHELAHLLAQFRAGRKRIRPHGIEWRKACSDLGIGDEKRCHTLPFPVRRRARPYAYQCPNCRRHFPRVRRIRRSVACLACCRAYNGGRFDGRFKLRPVK
ncbi:MAG: SprT-like domain-containing protein [Chthoniobacterales bacterium]